MPMLLSLWLGAQIGEIDPATASEDDVVAYRRALVTEYRSAAVAVKLAPLLRLCEADDMAW